MIDEGLPRFLIEQGYIELRVINGEICGTLHFMFTKGLCINLTRMGYQYRYCFPDLLTATIALHTFDGTQDPDDFIVRKGFGADYTPADPYTSGRPLSEILK